ncbi:MAG TPA: hypothetical protein VIV66_22850 [Pyrinomonadaceae bacterium]
MAERFPNESVIRAYVLGTLSEQEIERLDERSVTEDEFADFLRVVENDLVDAYIKGELSGSSLEQFKSNYLSTTSGREKLEFAQALETFSEKHANRPTVESTEILPVLPAKRNAWGGFLGFSGFSFSAWPRWAAVSVAVVLIALGGWLTYNNTRLRQVSQNNRATDLKEPNQLNRQPARPSESNLKDAEQPQQASAHRENEGLKQENAEEQQRATEPRVSPGEPRAVSVSSFILTPQMRGVEQIRTISWPAKTSVVEMQLRLEPDDYSSYRVVLVDKSNRALWRTGVLRVQGSGDNRTLIIRFPTTLLKPEIYVLQVYGLAAGKSEMLNEYSFRVAS